MKIVIVGAGKVGVALTRHLAVENKVTVIDQNPHLVENIINIYDVMGVCGNGASYDVQKEADVEQADLLIAMGEYSKCIQEIGSVPEDERGYRLTLLLGWAYSNLAVLGDHNENENTEDADQEMLSKAVDILMTIEDEGGNDPVWNSRMCYALWMIDGRESDALRYADRWMELDPKSDDARNQNRTIREFLEGTPAPEMYDEGQWDAVEEHIAAHFGDFPNVYHELVSPDIHVDICLIPPRRDHDYFTLVTMGMGAHEMDIPEEAEDTRRRAEVMINLPRDWKLDEESLQDSRWYWPIRMLKDVARLPVSTGCWLGWGHTVGMDEGERYDESTDLCGCIMLNPGVFGEDSYVCDLPDGDCVEFFQVVPLYAEEIQYKIGNGAEALLDITNDDMLEVIDPQRLNAVTDFDSIDHDDSVMDAARTHQRIIDRLHRIRFLRLDKVRRHASPCHYHKQQTSQTFRQSRFHNCSKIKDTVVFLFTKIRNKLFKNYNFYIYSPKQ